MAQNKGFQLGGLGSPCCCTSGGGSTSCSPCNIPNTNLTIGWANSFSGPGSDTLVYSSAGPIWQTGCSGAGASVIFSFGCSGGGIELRVYYFTAGSCPGGTSTYCSNLIGSPRALVLASYSCGPPLSLSFTLTGCVFLVAGGYTGFTVTS